MTAASLAAYSLMISLVLALVGWLAERALTGLHLPTRWAWVFALGLGVLLPGIAYFSARPGRAEPVIRAEAEFESEKTGSAAISPGAAGGAGAVAVIPDEPPLAERVVWGRLLDPAITALQASGPAARVIAGGWITSSLLLISLLTVSAVRLRRHWRAWPTKQVMGRTVILSDSVGPATMGLLRPRIVIPGWVARLPEAELECVLRHEQEHVRAKDTLVLSAGLACLVCFPWNPIAWWQLRRLRTAVEIDCDRRVLLGGVAPASYGNLLVRLAARGSHRTLPAPALIGSTTTLERRLRNMALLNRRITYLSPVMSFAAALPLIFVACVTEAPAGAPADSSAPTALENAVPQDAPRNELVSIVMAADGSILVDGAAHPVDQVSELLIPHPRTTVIGIDAHRDAPYGLVSALTDEVRMSGLRMVLFAEHDASPPSLERSLDMLMRDGLGAILPPIEGGFERRSPPPANVEVVMEAPPANAARFERHIMRLEVLPTGRVRASQEARGVIAELATSEVAEFYRAELAQNRNLIAVLAIHGEARYGHMYDAFSAIREGGATRFTFELAQ